MCTPDTAVQTDIIKGILFCRTKGGENMETGRSNRVWPIDVGSFGGGLGL